MPPMRARPQKETPSPFFPKGPCNCVVYIRALKGFLYPYFGVYLCTTMILGPFGLQKSIVVSAASVVCKGFGPQKNLHSRSDLSSPKVQVPKYRYLSKTMTRIPNLKWTPRLSYVLKYFGPLGGYRILERLGGFCRRHRQGIHHLQSSPRNFWGAVEERKP